MQFRSMMKRALCLALVALTLCAATLPALAAGPSYYVTASRLYVRKGPSSGYKVVDTLRRGTVVTRVKSRNGWYYVKYSRGSGWVYRGYLSDVPGGSPTGGGKYRTTCNLYVRAKPTVDASALTKLKKGTRVKVLKAHGSWVYVSYSGGKGWCAAKYLTRA